MKCQAVCLALGYDGKEATIPNFKELMDGEAMSFNPQSHHKTEQTYGQISQCPSNPLDPVPLEGTENKLVILRKKHLQKESFSPRAQNP